MAKQSVTRTARLKKAAKAKSADVVLEDLTGVSLEAYGLSKTVELVEYAQIGMVRAFADLEVPHDGAAEYFEPIANELSELTMRTREISRRIVSIGQRLHPMLCRPAREGKACGPTHGRVARSVRRRRTPGRS